MNIDPKGVSLWVNLVDLCRVFQLLQDISRADSPTVHFDSYKGGWMVVSLEKVVGIDVRRQVRRN